MLLSQIFVRHLLVLDTYSSLSGRTDAAKQPLALGANSRRYNEVIDKRRYCLLITYE